MNNLDHYQSVIEGLLFIVGDEGISLKQMASLLELDEKMTKQVLDELKKTYSSDVKRGIHLVYLGEKYKLATKMENYEYYQKLTAQNQNSLSNAALETLAIIAYNQPVTRLMVEEIRGVGSDTMMRKLQAKALIKEVGREEDNPGRPILYAVTEEFMDAFNLQSLNELPELQAIEELDNDGNIFNAKYMEDDEE